MKAKQYLGNIPLFKDLPTDQLGRLAGMAVSSTYARGQRIFFEGDPAGGFYVVLSGKVKIFKLSGEGKEQILHVMGPGDPFGEVPMFAGGNYPADAEAVEDSSLLFFSREAFLELIRMEPSLAMNMLASLSGRLKALTRMIENLSLKDVPERLAAYLLYGSRKGGNITELELDISKGQLASLLGTIPETLSRVLGKMAAQGIIDVQGRRIRILDRRLLEKQVEGSGSQDHAEKKKQHR